MPSGVRSGIPHVENWFADGEPTREFITFIHRLWERSGGFDDAADLNLKMMMATSRNLSSGAATHDTDNSQTYQVFDISPERTRMDPEKTEYLGMPGDSAGPMREIGELRMEIAMLHAIINRQASEIAELRELVEASQFLNRTIGVPLV